MSGGGQVDAYNLALSFLDVPQRIENLNEDTPQAGYCNTFWDRARKLVLEQCYWSFATRAVALALLVDQYQLTAAQLIYPGWRYIYARPVECLKAQAVTSLYGIRSNPYLSFWWRNGSTTDFNGPFRPPWLEALDYTNKASPGQSIDILTDQDSAWLIETVDPPNLAILPESFLACCAWQLAVYIAGPASASDAAKARAEKGAAKSLATALAQNLNEQQPDPYPQSPSIQARL